MKQFFYKIYARSFQLIMRIALFFIPWPKVKIIDGDDAIKKMALQIKSLKINKVLIVTDKGILSLGLMNELLKELVSFNIKYSIYSDTVANPTVNNVEAALLLYNKDECDSLIAFGGGSPIDCAKAVGARIAKPNKTLTQMRGLLKIRKKIPPFFAVPTTAGTGSETTVSAVISNSDTHVKYTMHDIVLMPKYAVLVPTLTLGLPPHITAATGIDALSHAVEAYIGGSNTRLTKEFALKSVQLIFENLFLAYTDGHNIVARKKMLLASHYAGIAFGRAYVGYVHSIAHAIGGKYSIPHGIAIGTVMPYVLEFYGDNINKSVAELADTVGIGLCTDTTKQKAEKFIQALKELNRSMNIPSNVSQLKESDIPELSALAVKEANPLYPVPQILFKEDIEILLYKMLA